MPSKSKQLVDQLSELCRVEERLRRILLRYNKLNSKLSNLVERDIHIVTALESLHGPMRRSELTDALDEFEAARHRVRLAMFALAKEQGSSHSDVARALGISRQLASRLAAESDATDI
jgi:ABC-type phosphate transport system auxiliary subunit